MRMNKTQLDKDASQGARSTMRTLVLVTVMIAGFSFSHTDVLAENAEPGAGKREEAKRVRAVRRVWTRCWVWTVTETVRILRSASPRRSGSVRLAAARNEWESFQILLRSGVPIRAIGLQAGDLTGPGETVIAAEDARLFRQHQFELTVGTSRNDSFEAGWYPDALIPFRHPVTREPLQQARITAVPFDLPAEQTHGFWVDIQVPSDAPAGKYKGTYWLTGEGHKIVKIPVSLTVWDFTLPRISTLKTALGWPASRMRQWAKSKSIEPVPDWDAVEEQCVEMMTRHRINCRPRRSLSPVAQADGSYKIPSDQIRALREFIDRYHVNALGVPRPTYIVKDPVKERAKLHAWYESWDAAIAELDRPDVVFYTYLIDEPNDKEAYEFVQKWGRAVREAKSRVKVMVTEQTWAQKEEWGDLYGAIDIWCPLFPIFKPESAAKRQELGETIWTYTALCQRKPPSPWWHTDFPLLNYRVPAWISWRYRIRGLLYWGGMAYWKQVKDPWTDPLTYGRSKGEKGPLYNGEGSIVYPGMAVGYDGIASSLRLKALRDSIEDYEYLAILERAGLARKAEQIIMPVARSWFDWEKDPKAYEIARARLAIVILAAKVSVRHGDRRHETTDEHR